jgi:hypothetical protein
MVQFCDGVTQNILKASNFKSVKEVIQNSFVAFREKKNSYNEATFVINMIVTLQAAKPQAMTIPEVDNLFHAIKLFKEHQGADASGLF